MKDPQCKRLYTWEGQWCDWVRSTISLREARTVIKWACQKYGLVAPFVKLHPPGETIDSFSQGGWISFNRGQVNPAIALHEAAHYISDQLFPTTPLAHHSPQFLGIYLWLLEAYRVAPRRALHASAKAAGLKWSPTWVMSPERLRRGRYA